MGPGLLVPKGLPITSVAQPKGLPITSVARLKGKRIAAWRHDAR